VSISYRDSGVDIDAGDRAVELIKAKVRSTFGPQVLTGLGSFGSLFAFGGYREPVLVASADGVGTKLKIAFALDKHDTIGIDLVHHCVNDILTAGAAPLFFLDYIAMDKLVPDRVAEIISGLAEGCRATGCALVGGETAEMPGIYAPGEYDVAGFIVGAVERSRVVDGNRIEEGDLIWGLPSSGLHTNGYSMVRKVLRGEPLKRHWPELGRTLGEELLEPHRCYLEPVRRLLEPSEIRGGKPAGRRAQAASRASHSPVDVRGMAHITGGGIPGNLARIIPDGKKALVRWGSWPVPAIFSAIQQRGNVDRREMLRVFNMGLGYLLVCPPDDRDRVSTTVPEAILVGEIVASDKGEKVEVSRG
jgi:phosphoribosylformylglycinamidine cyclo-ligase